MNEIEDYKAFYKSFSNDREFGGSYDHFDHLVKSRFMNTFGFVNNAILRKKPRRILDIGCGNGANLPFSNLYPDIEYNAIDYAEKTVSVAQQTFPNAKVREMDAFNLSYDEESMDLVILSSVIILYEDEGDRLKILREAKRVLKSDGAMVLVLWKDSFVLRNSMYWSRLFYGLAGQQIPKDFCGLHFKESEVVDMVSKVGLKVCNVDHTAVKFGVLESVRYLNGKKYNRDFGRAEKESGPIALNTTKDIAAVSGSETMAKVFSWTGKYIPNWFAMFSVYLVEKSRD